MDFWKWNWIFSVSIKWSDQVSKPRESVWWFEDFSSFLLCLFEGVKDINLVVCCWVWITMNWDVSVLCIEAVEKSGTSLSYLYSSAFYTFEWRLWSWGHSLTSTWWQTFVFRSSFSYSEVQTVHTFQYSIMFVWCEQRAGSWNLYSWMRVRRKKEINSQFNENSEILLRLLVSMFSCLEQ